MRRARPRSLAGGRALTPRRIRERVGIARKMARGPHEFASRQLALACSRRPLFPVRGSIPKRKRGRIRGVGSRTQSGGGGRRRNITRLHRYHGTHAQKPPRESLSTPRIVLGEGQRKFLAGRRVSLGTSPKQRCMRIIPGGRPEPCAAGKERPAGRRRLAPSLLIGAAASPQQFVGVALVC